MGKLIQEFKEFAVKGNAVDMAVGVIIGAAFGKIVTSIVDDIIMPPIGWLIGGVNFTDLKLTLPAEQITDGLKKVANQKKEAVDILKIENQQLKNRNYIINKKL